MRVAANSAMVEAYWRIGEAIFKECGDNDRAAYGKQVLQFISERLTVEFGAGFTERNLCNMRQFCLLFAIRHTLCAELGWSHYRVLMRIQDKDAREFCASECANRQCHKPESTKTPAGRAWACHHRLPLMTHRTLRLEGAPVPS